MDPVCHCREEPAGTARRGFLQDAAVGVGGLMAGPAAWAAAAQGPAGPAVAAQKGVPRHPGLHLEAIQRSYHPVCHATTKWEGGKGSQATAASRCLVVACLSPATFLDLY